MLPPMSSAAFTSIATERLLLRRFRGGDLEPFVAMRADPAVARYQGWSDFDRAAGEAFIAGMSAAEPDTPGAWFQFAIEHEGRFVGDCAVHVPADRPDEVELGVTLSPTGQRRGFAREALTGLIGWLFEERGKRAVEAVVDARNAPALALFEARGFVEEGRRAAPFKGELCTEVTWRLAAPSDAG